MLHIPLILDMESIEIVRTVFHPNISSVVLCKALLEKHNSLGSDSIKVQYRCIQWSYYLYDKQTSNPKHCTEHDNRW